MKINGFGEVVNSHRYTNVFFTALSLPGRSPALPGTFRAVKYVLFQIRCKGTKNIGHLQIKSEKTSFSRFLYVVEHKNALQCDKKCRYSGTTSVVTYSSRFAG